jgi:protein-disulfide isomerase
MGFRALVAALAVVAATLSLPSAGTGADALDTGQKEAMEKVVREYLLKHPEIVIEAIRTFQAREVQATKERAQANLVALRDELVNDPTSPFAGNPDGDVTIVEFFDYRCGFCKQVFPIVMALMEDDPNVRYVFKEFPILGPESVVASRAALAAWRLDKDKYLAFHVALMGSRGSLPESKVMTLAAKSGYDIEELRRELIDPEIEETLKQNIQLADSLNINGTPTFIIGNRLFPGAITAEALNGAVADTREACKKTGIC